MTVTFQHAGATLSGTVVLPPDGEVRAGLVFLHGSAPPTPDIGRSGPTCSSSMGWPHCRTTSPASAARREIGRASRSPTARVRRSPAVRFLTSDVLANGVPTGVLGMSQGAWIGPHAASASEDVAFVVALSGSTTGPREQDRFRIEHELARDGFAQDAVDAALRVWDECDALFGSGADDRALCDAFAPHRDEPWSRYFVFGDPNRSRTDA